MRKRLYGFAVLLILMTGGVKFAAADDVHPMIVYTLGQLVPESELIPLGTPEDLGGTVLEGDIELKGRIDFAANGMTAGIFQATTQHGVRALVHMPFTEHGTFIHGIVTLTDELGNSHIYRPGDSYFIQQGSNILWEQRVPIVQKSFFNFTTP
jgi:uncharacterized protein